MNNPDKNINSGDSSIRLPEQQFTALLSEIMENLSAGIFVSDDEGKHVFSNRILSSVLHDLPRSADAVKVASVVTLHFPDATAEIREMFDLSGRQKMNYKTVLIANGTLLKICRNDFALNDGKYIFWSFDKLHDIGDDKTDTHASDSRNVLLLERIAYLSELISRLNRSRSGLDSKEKINDKFLSAVAHDIKSPFQGLLGMCDVIISSDDLSPEQMRHYVGSIKNSAVNIYQMIEKLLQWSFINLSGKSFLPVKCDPKWEVSTAINSFKSVAENKQITFENNIADDTMLFADEKMLGSIIRNLLSNSIKFSMPGGKVKIYSRTEENNTLLIIEDRGTGMPAEIINKILIENEIISTRGTENEDGFGLGLILVKEMVRIHGGTIRIESTPGSGSAFYIEFPNILGKGF